MYPDPVEQAKKLALFGLAGALVRLPSSLTLYLIADCTQANTLALVISGVFLLASWRWYFRFTVGKLLLTRPETLC